MYIYIYIYIYTYILTYLPTYIQPYLLLEPSDPVKRARLASLLQVDPQAGIGAKSVEILNSKSISLNLGLGFRETLNNRNLQLSLGSGFRETLNTRNLRLSSALTISRRSRPSGGHLDIQAPCDVLVSQPVLGFGLY